MITEKHLCCLSEWVLWLKSDTGTPLTFTRMINQQKISSCCAYKHMTFASLNLCIIPKVDQHSFTDFPQRCFIVIFSRVDVSCAKKQVKSFSHLCVSLCINMVSVRLPVYRLCTCQLLQPWTCLDFTDYNYTLITLMQYCNKAHWMWEYNRHPFPSPPKTHPPRLQKNALFFNAIP